jgi:hypothetical protein
MRIFCLICIVGLFSSCASRMTTAAWQTEADETRVLLMRTESDVYGDFFKLRIFHSDLMQMPGDTSRTPYPSLEQVFDSIIAPANGVVIQRMKYDTAYYAVQRALEGKSKAPLKGELASLHSVYEQRKKNLPTTQETFKTEYYRLRKMYQDTCQKYGVRRLGPDEYAWMIDQRIMVWEDSLEQVGRMVAGAKLHLKSKFTNYKSSEYFAAYRPVSELEAMMKNFDSIMAQLQNSLSRFEEGNKEDYLYFGPHLRVRMEVQATEDLFVQAGILMTQCREKEREYYSQYPAGR